MAPTRRSSLPLAPPATMQPLTAEEVAHDLSPPVEEDEEQSTKPSLPNLTSRKHESMSIEQVYLTSKQSTRLNHWRNNPYATGLVEPTWYDEVHRQQNDGGDDNNEANGPNRRCCADVGDPEMDPTCGCLVISGYVCGMFNAGRVGNMAILKESHVMVDEFAHNDEDEEGEPTGKLVTRKVSKRKIDLVVGPYWPFLLFVTCPLILGVSLWTAVVAVFVPNYNMIVVIVWSLMTFGLCFSLFSVSCRDPGLLPKYKLIPSDTEQGQTGSRTSWMWNDRSQSYVPRGAYYDSDCAVVVEDFDHTCPWTGTAIGKKNLFAFHCFIGFIFSCLIMDIILLTSASII